MTPEEEYENLDEKVLLIQILMELKQIRGCLEPEERENEETFECNSCGETVFASERRKHARDTHNAPDIPIDDLGLFG